MIKKLARIWIPIALFELAWFSASPIIATTLFIFIPNILNNIFEIRIRKMRR